MARGTEVSDDALKTRSIFSGARSTWRPFPPMAADVNMRRYRLPITMLCAVGILMSAAVVIQSRWPAALSPLEVQLIGEWTSDAGKSIRIFRSDHSFATDNGQFEGHWSIDHNKLTIMYWQPFSLRDAYYVDGFLVQIRRSFKVDTYMWEIEFADDRQTHTLIFPENDTHNPGERWNWTRLAGK